MEGTNAVDRHNVHRQLAIYEVAKSSRDRQLTEIKELLREEFRRRGVPEQPETWLDAVAVEASFGKPYIIDFAVAEAADKVMKAPDPAAGQASVGKTEALQSTGQRSIHGVAQRTWRSGRPVGRLPGLPAVAAVGGMVVLALGAATGIAALRRRNR